MQFPNMSEKYPATHFDNLLKYLHLSSICKHLKHSPNLKVYTTITWITKMGLIICIFVDSGDVHVHVKLRVEAFHAAGKQTGTLRAANTLAH